MRILPDVLGGGAVSYQAFDEEALRMAYALDRDRPRVRVSLVTSLDGAVELDGLSRGLSNEVDQQVLALLRAETDALLVGANTLRRERYRGLRVSASAQQWRRAHDLPDHPTLVIASASLDLDPASPVFTEAPVRPVVLTHADAPVSRWRLVERFCDIVGLGDIETNLVSGLAELRRRGLGQILCEGGPHLFGAMLAANLVDELCLTVSPLLAGPGPGRIVAGHGLGPPVGMRLAHVIAAGSTLLTRYVRDR